MNDLSKLSLQPRPRKAPARSKRARLSGKGKLALAVAGAMALPAIAAPGEWDRFEIGDAGEATIELDPMPFEQAGSSFPGSAFYYLDSSQSSPGFGEGIYSDGAIDRGPSAQSMRIDNSGVDRNRALDCLTAAIYYEAASEPDSGQRAVAQVVLNRVAHSAYPNTVCGVVYQGSQRKTGCQFTFTCDGSLARRPSRMFWRRAQSTALAALGGYVHVPAGLATHYHTVQVSPYWAPKLHYLGTVGAHRFYRFGGSAGRPGAFRFAYRGGEPTAQLLKASEFARTDEKALDPVALQQAFDARRAEAQLAAATREQPAQQSLSPAPSYTGELQARGGDALYRGEKLPDASGVRPEYRNSGRWIGKPGA